MVSLVTIMDDQGKPVLRKIIFTIVNNKDADDLATQGARANAIMVLTYLTQNILVPTPQDLTHCGLLMPYGDIDLGQHLLRQWLVARRHQAFTCTNVDLSSKAFCGIHLWAQVLMNLIMCSEINPLWPGDAICQHGTRSTLVQVMACCLTAPSHYLNQCWLIIGEVNWYSSQGIILRRCEDTNQ